jgi:hypothetical protein
MLAENGLWCLFCEGGRRAINFAESNKQFLSKRLRDGNIDEARTISRIAWDNFPILKESADTKNSGDTSKRSATDNQCTNTDSNQHRIERANVYIRKEPTIDPTMLTRNNPKFKWTTEPTCIYI